MSHNLYVGSPTSTLDGDEEESPTPFAKGGMDDSSRNKDKTSPTYKPMVAMSIDQNNGFNGVNSVKQNTFAFGSVTASKQNDRKLEARKFRD
jgi:hypothetical protein